MSSIRLHLIAASIIGLSTLCSCSDDDKNDAPTGDTITIASLEKELTETKERLELSEEKVMVLESVDSNQKIKELEEDLEVHETSISQLEANKTLVLNFYQEVLGDKDVSAVDKYIGDVYIQHHKGLDDGKDAVKDFISRQTNKITIMVELLFAQDDLVFIHTKQGETIIMDVFRVEDNLLVEHWDAFQ